MDSLEPPEEEFDDSLAIPDSELVSPNVPRRETVDSSSCIPFSSTLGPPVKFKAPQRNLFIPGVPIEVKIVSFERNVTTNILNSNLYTVEIRHGEFEWTIKKRYKHFLYLHQQLRIYRTSLNIPIPTKTHKERRASFKNDILRNKDKKSRNLPRFPARPEALVPLEKTEQRMKLLQEYLQSLVGISLYRNHYETANFLEVSNLSFVEELGFKGKEGMLKKRTRSVHPGRQGCNLCGMFDSGFCVRCNYICSDLCGSWRTRWVLLKESYIAYIRPKDGRVKAVILFDCGFQVSSGIFSTGYRNGLHIVNLSRNIVLKCPTRRVTNDWISAIKEILSKDGRDFTMKNRYYSFTPVRSTVPCAWFVDGSSYMSAVADAIEQAREEIYIADWWLSPEIHMKRPALEGDYWRLDTLLHRKAAVGVKIFILLYKEVELALGINSFYSKQRIVGNYGDNIKVIRHPDHAKAGVLFWAHHEKLVVVDQSIAFVGGIDLCYGRWDDYRHKLTDLGSAYLPSPDTLHAEERMATDAMLNNNFCDSEGEDVMVQPSMENMKCDTPPEERKGLFLSVKNKGRELMHMLSITSDEDDDDEELKSKEKEVQSVGTDEICISLDESCNEVKRVLSAEELGPVKLWLGKDYNNFIVKDFNDLDKPFQDLVDRNKTPRMPWHDIGAMVQGVGARDVARHFIQRWNAVKLEKAKTVPQYPYLLPKSYSEFKQEYDLPDVKTVNVTCQVVRSISHWSAGFLDIDTWEGSIHEAYVDAITKARYYVYIENQFFISLICNQVKNQVSEAIFKRIMRAHRERTTFRVFVVLPLLPGFEGEVGTPSGTALHAITHWNYSSISRGKDSLLVRLKESGIKEPEEYITFHGLRNHSTLHGKPITELIYVHSKLLIADDRLVICGSANINDRSLIGKRDSEVAVVIEDEEFTQGTMNGQPVSCGRYSGSLRRHLFREHLGVLETNKAGIDINDPVSSQFYHNVWRRVAARNSEIFETVFRCIPTNEARDFQELKKFTQEPSVSDVDPDTAKILLSKVQGHLVTFPLYFLHNETLTPNPSSVQGMLPTSLWT